MKIPDARKTLLCRPAHGPAGGTAGTVKIGTIKFTPNPLDNIDDVFPLPSILSPVPMPLILRRVRGPGNFPGLRRSRKRSPNRVWEPNML
jgi:hypothetical protein